MLLEWVHPWSSHDSKVHSLILADQAKDFCTEGMYMCKPSFASKPAKGESIRPVPEPNSYRPSSARCNKPAIREVMSKSWGGMPVQAQICGGLLKPQLNQAMET